MPMTRIPSMSVPEAIPAGFFAAAARPAVVLVTEKYVREHLARWPTDAPPVDTSLTVRRIVGAALQAGLSTRDVASGVALGVLRAMRDCGEEMLDPALLRRTAAAVIAAVTDHGGAVRDGVDGILDAATRIADTLNVDSSPAIAAAGVGIVDVLGEEMRVI